MDGLLTTSVVLHVGRGGYRGGLGGSSSPAFPRFMDAPLKTPFYFWDETMKRKRGGRRREGEKEEESGHEPLYMFELDSPLHVGIDQRR